MSSLGDLNEFAKSFRKDAWDAIKKDPERALLGAVDPFSSWMWGSITGKDYDPILNVFGSPAGGGDLGMDRNGGQYANARDRGVDIEAGQNFFGIGDAIAGFYGGSAATSALGGLGGGSADLGATGGGGLLGSGGGDAAAASASTGGGSMSTFGGGTNAAAGLMGNAQPQSAPQQQMAMQQPDVQAQQAARLKLQEAMQLQALRQKPNKTMDEWMQLQKASQNQGLLG